MSTSLFFLSFFFSLPFSGFFRGHALPRLRGNTLGIILVSVGWRFQSGSRVWIRVVARGCKCVLYFIPLSLACALTLTDRLSLRLITVSYLKFSLCISPPARHAIPLRFTPFALSFLCFCFLLFSAERRSTLLPLFHPPHHIYSHIILPLHRIRFPLDSSVVVLYSSVKVYIHTIVSARVGLSLLSPTLELTLV